MWALAINGSPPAAAADERKTEHAIAAVDELEELNRVLRTLVTWDTGDYVPIALIQPGQLRFASLNVEDKLKAALKAGAATPQPGGGYLLGHDHGRSILPASAAVPVIKGPVGYVLVDGHHDVLSSLALGARTVPVKVEGPDLSHLDPDAFWREAEALGKVYPHLLGGAWKLPPRHFHELIDDPIRYFAAISARKCTAVGQDPSATTGFDHPLWIKVGKDVPFIEFKIADALFGADPDFGYRNSMGNSPPDTLVEHARELLAGHPVPDLRLVPSRTHFTALPSLCEAQ